MAKEGNTLEEILKLLERADEGVVIEKGLKSDTARGKALDALEAYAERCAIEDKLYVPELDGEGLKPYMESSEEFKKFLGKMRPEEKDERVKEIAGSSVMSCLTNAVNLIAEKGRDEIKSKGLLKLIGDKKFVEQAEEKDGKIMAVYRAYTQFKQYAEEIKKGEKGDVSAIPEEVMKELMQEASEERKAELKELYDRQYDALRKKLPEAAVKNIASLVVAKASDKPISLDKIAEKHVKKIEDKLKELVGETRGYEEAAIDSAASTIEGLAKSTDREKEELARQYLYFANKGYAIGQRDFKDLS
jgi:hypothetical protein